MVESYKHSLAKKLLTKWLREGEHNSETEQMHSFSNICWRLNRTSWHKGVWEEYPICKEGLGLSLVWDEYGDYEDRTPTFDEVKALGVVCIADVAIQCKGYLHSVFEIVHKSPLTAKKRQFYQENNIDCYVVSAEWILCQIEKPSKLNCLERI